MSSSRIASRPHRPLLRLSISLAALLLLGAGVAQADPQSLGTPSTDLALFKEFLDDPVPPGGTVELQFRILNRNASFDATDITFTDDLDATLSGLVAVGLPANDVCGAGSQISGTGLLSLTGGFLEARSDCIFTVTLLVPSSAPGGLYPNTTSTVAADIGGPVTGDPATDDLIVVPAPILAKTFLVDPAATGGSTDIEFTISNTSTTSSATDIAFIDELTTFLPFPVSVTLPPVPDPPCGAGSTLSLIVLGANRQGLSLAGGNLVASASCTFQVTVGIPAGLSPNFYTNVTEVITATVDAEGVTGNPAEASFEVIAGVLIQKQFTDDPVNPSDTVTLEFTLENPNGYDASGIAFSDDLNAVIPGLAAVGLPSADDCGIGSVLAGSTNLAFSGGFLAAGASCTFAVTLQVPAGATPGFYPNTTSQTTATVEGLAATGLAATDDLEIASLLFTKEFIDDPVVAGSPVTLRFTIENITAASAATGITFTDNLNLVLSGLAATGLPLNDICGAGSSISGTSDLSFTGGNLPAATSCTFDVTVQVPAGALDGSYSNTTSDLAATVGGNAVVLPPATDLLQVDSTLILLAKTFTDELVQPGDTTTLEFELTNAGGQTITSIDFTDDLGAALTGLVADSVEVNDCGFTVSGVPGGNLGFTGGSLAPLGTCTVQLTLTVPAGASPGAYVNTTSSVSGLIGALPVTGVPATDTLHVVAATFTKAFDGPTTPGGTAVLTFTLTNLDAGAAILDLSFFDDLDAVLPGLVAVGLPANEVCGAGSVISGTDVVTLTRGQLPASSACDIAVTVQVPLAAAVGTFLNLTSALSSGGFEVAEAASAELVIEPPPSFGKEFAPDLVALGGVSTLTFTIDNTAATVTATALAFIDNLPVGTEVAPLPNSASTCGGVVTAVPGTGEISLSGGSVGAGATCTVQVDVAGTVAGSHVNVTGDLTSSQGNSGTASDTLEVVVTDLVLTKTFQSAPVLPGGLVDVEYTVSNLSASLAATALTFSDDYDAALAGLVAVGLPEADVCGAGSQAAGTTQLTLTGGTVAASSSCTFTVTLQVPGAAVAGSYPGATSSVDAMLGPLAASGPPASDELDVAYLEFSKSFGGVVTAGGSVLLTFTLTNPDPVNAATGLTFTDDLDAVLPGLAAVGLPENDVCGVGSQLTGTSVLQLVAGSVAAAGSCTFDVSVEVPATAAGGTFLNVTSVLEGDVGGTSVVANPAAAEAGLEITGLPLAIPVDAPWALLALVLLLAAVATRQIRLT